MADKNQKFRRALGTELQVWRREGLVDEGLASSLTERYRLDKLRAEAHGTLMNTIFLLGAALIGCGVVAFVAAHWACVPVWAKVAMLTAAMRAAHLGGYWLWRLRRPAREYLGHALTVLGTLIFGANIALFAQIFHISEEFYSGFMWWAVGAALAAYALRSVPNAVVAVVASFGWFCGFLAETETALLIYPAIAVVVFLPACYLWRSYWLFVATTLAATAALVTNGMIFAENEAGGVLAFILPVMALWCYGEFHGREGRWPGFGTVAATLGAAGLTGCAYFLSFSETAGELLADYTTRGLTIVQGQQHALALGMPFGAVIILVVLAVLGRRGHWRRMLLPILAGVAAIGTVVQITSDVWMVVAFNVIAVVIAGYGIGVGAREYKRAPYWAGLGLIVLLIVSRFFEYETNLMVKSAGFIAAGAILIYAGIKFENRRRLRQAQEEEKPNG